MNPRCYIDAVPRMSSARHLLPVLLLSLCCAAQDSPVRDLADKILGRLQSRRAVLLEVKSNTGDAADAADVRRALESQLRAQGVQFAIAAQATDEVRVTLATSATEQVWVAEIGHGDQREIAIVTRPRSAAGAATDAGARVSLRTTRLLA